MIYHVKNFISKELTYFKTLTKQAQYLFISILLYNFVQPILFIFVDAFIWRQTNDIQAVAFYMLINYVGLPIGFYINGLLLKRYTPQRLYLMGNILRGMSVILLIFISHVTYLSILIFGLISGISGGFHWANRNFMTLRMTKSDNRMYFVSLDNASTILTSIIVPSIIGWFIIYGGKVYLYSTIQAYQIISIIALIILFLSGIVIKNISTPTTPVSQVLFLKVSTYWTKLRLFSIIHGLINGMIILMPTIITLTFLGKEDILGTTQSYMAVLSAIALYYSGKFIKVNHRLRILLISIVLTLFGSLFFGITFSVIGVLCYLTLQAFADPFNQVCFISISYDAMDKEESQTKIHHYNYILDQEIFHNIGRVCGIIFLLLLIHIFSNTFALRFTPFILATSQIFLLVVAKSIEKKK